MDLREQMLSLQALAAPFYSEGRFGHHLVVVDEPSGFGGCDKATNPAEVLLAGLGASICVTLHGHAALLGIEVGRLEVRLSGSLDSRGFYGTDPAVRAGFGALALTIAMESSAGPAERATLLAAVERGCPVLDTCRKATPITLAFE